MNLTEHTEAALQMRKNLVRLFRSETKENRMLAVEMMLEVGMPLEVFPYVFELYFGGWNISQEAFARNTALADTLLSRALPKSILDYADHYLQNIDRLHGPAYGIFRGDTLFDLLLSEKVTDLQGLAQLLAADPIWVEHSDLLPYLVARLDQVDKNIFIDSGFQYHHLHQHLMKPLFMAHDPNFRKREFLAQYVVGNTLDLYNTSLNAVPEEYADFPGITVLDIRGTSIQQVPEWLLRNLLEIHANQRCSRAIMRQVSGIQPQDFYLAYRGLFQHAQYSTGRKQYHRAIVAFGKVMPVLDDPYFPVADQMRYFEFYFHAAFMVEDWLLCERILRHACDHLPGKDGPWQWKNWNQYQLHFVRSGTIHHWQEVVASFVQKHRQYELLLSSRRMDFWVYATRKTVAKGEEQEALELLRQAMASSTPECLWRFPWFLFFRQLHSQGRFGEMVATIAEFWPAILQVRERMSEWLGRRGEVTCMWIEAYLHEGQTPTAEIWCNRLIQEFMAFEGQPNARLYSNFYYARKAAYAACGYLSRIYAEEHPRCSVYYAGLEGREPPPSSQKTSPI